MLNPFPPDALIPNENHRHMGVPEKTNVGALIGETRGSIEIIENVTPLPRRIEGRVHDGKIVHASLQWQVTQPFLVVVR